MMLYFFQTQSEVGLEMLDEKKMEEIIKKIFIILNEERVSPYDGLMIAEEILQSSVERIAATQNLNPDQLRYKLAKQLFGGNFGTKSEPQKKVLVVGEDRGWIGNTKTTTENN